MKRIRLSSKMIFQKVVLAIIICVLLFYTITDFNILLPVAILIFVSAGYVVFFTGDNIEFDGNCMYIIEKDGEIEVNLKDISDVSTTDGVMDFNRSWQITYKYEGKDYYTRFYPKHFSSSFKTFKEYVSEKNPSVEIKDYLKYPFDN